ncbi:MAG: ASPIC/UnbV domain-containing protein [Bacteroidales bacterium]|nr:ASPIC/UnbV domain-containing protein [Bacteroidales bacterium]
MRRSTTGYLSQNDHRLHFGLADAGLVESLEITWPSGKVQHLENIEVNQIITIKEQ